MSAKRYDLDAEMRRRAPYAVAIVELSNRLKVWPVGFSETVQYAWLQLTRCAMTIEGRTL